MAGQSQKRLKITLKMCFFSNYSEVLCFKSNGISTVENQRHYYNFPSVRAQSDDQNSFPKLRALLVSGLVCLHSVLFSRRLSYQRWA